jgi:hypothetical protein
MSGIDWDTITPEQALALAFFDCHVKHDVKKKPDPNDETSYASCVDQGSPKQLTDIKYQIDGYVLTTKQMNNFGFQGNYVPIRINGKGDFVSGYFVPLTAALRNRPLSQKMLLLPNAKSPIKIVTKEENSILYNGVNFLQTGQIRSKSQFYGDFTKEFPYVMTIKENGNPPKKDNTISFPPGLKSRAITEKSPNMVISLPTWYDRVFSSEKRS